MLIIPYDIIPMTSYNNIISPINSYDVLILSLWCIQKKSHIPIIQFWLDHILPWTSHDFDA